MGGLTFIFCPTTAFSQFNQPSIRTAPATWNRLIDPWKPYPLAGQVFFVCRRTGGNPADVRCTVRAMSRQHPGNFRSVARQRPGKFPVTIRAIPSPLERVVMAAAKAKASRHAVTPQLRPKGKVSLPVASSAPSRGRDELLFNLSVPPASRAGRRHRQNKFHFFLVKLPVHRHQSCLFER